MERVPVNERQEPFYRFLRHTAAVVRQDTTSAQFEMGIKINQVKNCISVELGHPPKLPIGHAFDVYISGTVVKRLLLGTNDEGENDRIKVLKINDVKSHICFGPAFDQHLAVGDELRIASLLVDNYNANNINRRLTQLVYAGQGTFTRKEKVIFRKAPCSVKSTNGNTGKGLTVSCESDLVPDNQTRLAILFECSPINSVLVKGRWGEPTVQIDRLPITCRHPLLIQIATQRGHGKPSYTLKQELELVV